MSSEKDFSDWRRGWCAGAGLKTVENAPNPEYSAGWSAGRQAFREAMEAERARRGLPPGAMVRIVENAPAPEKTCGTIEGCNITEQCEHASWYDWWRCAEGHDVDVNPCPHYTPRDGGR